MSKEETTAEEQVKALTEENKKLKSDLEKEVKSSKDKDGIIEGLNKALEAKEKENDSLSPHPVFAFKKKKYELVDAKSRAMYKGKVVSITADALKEDIELLEFCVKKGFGCLVEKGGKE